MDEPLELLTDIDMVLMIENGIRGVICQSRHRHAVANNKYMSSYDENIETSYLQNLDANNQYGRAMCKKLPVGEFTWDNPKNYAEDLTKNHDENCDYGAILEIDVEYPVMAKIMHLPEH